MTDIPLEPFLVAFGVEYNPTRLGNQMIRCPNPSHDDRTPSASLHLAKGVWNCQACGHGGTAIDLIITVEGVSVRDAFRRSTEIAGESDGELPREPVRNGYGLPASAGPGRRDGKGVSPWRGFR